jgi:hypothetical protein
MQFICTFLCKTALFGAIFCNFKFPITYVRFHLSAVQSGIYVAQSDRDRISSSSEFTRLPIILSHLSALMMPVRRALHFSDPNRIFIRHSLQLLQAARSQRLLPAPGWRVPGHHRRWRRNSCVQQPRQNRLSAACRAVDDAARSR